MKTNLIFLLILIFSCNHTTIKNKTESFQYENSEKENIVISESSSLDKFEFCLFPKRIYFYKGIDNPIEIKTFGCNIDSIQFLVEGCNGNVSKIDEDLFLLKLNEFGNFKIKSIFYKNGEFKEFTSKHFQSKTLPIQNVTVANLEAGEIEKEKLLAYSLIKAGILNMDIDINFDIIEFTVSTFDENGDNIENKSNSEYFTEQQILQIKDLKSGDKVYFENIRGKTFDEIERNLGTLVFKIK